MTLPESQYCATLVSIITAHEITAFYYKKAYVATANHENASVLF